MHVMQEEHEMSVPVIGHFCWFLDMIGITGKFGLYLQSGIEWELEQVIVFCVQMKYLYELISLEDNFQLLIMNILNW